MKIALDYDGTYTADKTSWDVFLLSAMRGGAQVVCCTNRANNTSENADIIRDMGFHKIPIVYAAKYKDKWQAMSMNGHKPNDFIWIDDRPMLIKKSK